MVIPNTSSSAGTTIKTAVKFQYSRSCASIRESSSTSASGSGGTSSVSVELRKPILIVYHTASVQPTANRKYFRKKNQSMADFQQCGELQSLWSESD